MGFAAASYRSSVVASTLLDSQMQPRDLPERWLRRLEAFTDETYGPDYKYRGRLGASDFSTTSVVQIRFPDGSTACFRSAFFIAEPEWNEVAVFTEHCGYHLLPHYDLQIDLLDPGPRLPAEGE